MLTHNQALLAGFNTIYLYSSSVGAYFLDHPESFARNYMYHLYSLILSGLPEWANFANIFRSSCGQNFFGDY